VVVPEPGHELYGYLPYWEMDESIADHVAATPLTTLALFSVTHRGQGLLNQGTRGYAAITSDTGRRLIREAHERGVRVELVYTSFGAARNRRLLERPAVQATVIAELVALAGDLGVDGVNVDVEGLDPTLVAAYGAFVADVRAAVLAADPGDTVSVATGAHALGAAMAAAAAGAGADRVFLMGYDYRTGRSQPGASAPIDRADGETLTLRTSLDRYGALGVPPERLWLGLPLYGVEWPVVAPLVGAPSSGRGEAWFPRGHVDLLSNPAAVPVRDEVEQVDVYFLGSDGSVGAPSNDPAATPDGRTWRAVYVDTPGTLAPKLALANERGLAGAGFWAIGYERGLPAYTDLMRRFVAAETLP
jgi:spore germination protein YaaH